MSPNPRLTPQPQHFRMGSYFKLGSWGIEFVKKMSHESRLGAPRHYDWSPCQKRKETERRRFCEEGDTHRHREGRRKQRLKPSCHKPGDIWGYARSQKRHGKKSGVLRENMTLATPYFGAFSLQICERTNFCHLKPPSLWDSVTAALERTTVVRQRGRDPGTGAQAAKGTPSLPPPSFPCPAARSHNSTGQTPNSGSVDETHGNSPTQNKPTTEETPRWKRVLKNDHIYCR